MTQLDLLKQVGYKQIFNLIYRQYFSNSSYSCVINADQELRRAFDELILRPYSKEIDVSYARKTEIATQVFLELSGVNPHALKD